MIKKILSCIVILMLILSLSGCDFYTADTAELLSPPALSGELSPIAEVISSSAGSEYILKYPSRGDYRSAVVTEDINGDGSIEAVAFYSTTDGETVTMNINVIDETSEGWKSIATQKIVAGGVDRIEFCDLDNDGVEEILVGWEIYGTSEMQLAVYSLGKNSLTQRLLQKYTHFTTCNLDEDKRNEILIIKTATAEQNNSALLFALSEDGITEVSSCELDNSAKTVNEPLIASLSTGKPAVYLDEIKGVGAVTEVLFFEKGTLVNPLYDPDSKETTSTLRSASFTIADINEDGIVEIPVQENIPSVTRSDVNEKLYLTNWCSFNGEKLTVQMTTMINVNDGYYYTIPQKWVGSIAVLKDTDNNLREIYKYNPEDMTVGSSLLYIKAVKKKDWDEGKYKASGVNEIMNNGKVSYICRISEDAAAEGLTLENVRDNFKLAE
ncbi:MAG: hypothetical protein J6J30_04085 [Clostridia bacterium]|nr:hypothetical protein [Oscillospiraceae bacterium]MBP3600241.1 hypothetical protein [Clostridia bacterium]